MHIANVTKRDDSPSVAKEEMALLGHLAISIRALIGSSDLLTRCDLLYKYTILL